MNPGLQRNVGEIQRRVHEAAERAGRDPGEITIVAVSKTFDRELMDQAYDLGLRVFGESRVQEIRAKCQRPLPPGAELHMIGPLQTNKIRQVLPFIDVLQTVDRLRLVSALAREPNLVENGLGVMLQVNIAGEEQKSGIAPDEAAELLKAVMKVQGLQPLGLMTMAPYGADDSTLRSVFSGLRLLRDSLQESHGIALPNLSMGMSDDFEIAIQEGATHVRIGRAIFGTR